MQIDDEGNEIPVGSFTLDPGESVDVSVTQGANRADPIAFSVLSGNVTVTIGGITQSVGEGQSATMVTDLTAPSVVLSSNATEPVRTSPIAVSATFSEPVIGFEARSIVVNNATISGFTGAGANYSFNLTPIADGPVTASIPAGAAVDAAGMGSLDSNQFSRTYRANRAPVCSAATPSVAQMWSPNHGLVPIQINGVTDPDGDALTIAVSSIFQDEPTDGGGDGNTAIDGYGVGTSTAQVRAERSGKRDGRVYHIRFTGTDTLGASCAAEVQVGVAKNNSEPAVDQGAIFDSARPTTRQEEQEHLDCTGHNHLPQQQQ